jgi:hypothetical protein
MIKKLYLVLIHKSVNIGISVPASSISLHEIVSQIGADYPIKVIEVGTQNELSGWSLGDYVGYLTHRSKDHKILNLISLEFSKTPLASWIHSPQIVRKIDWINLLWPIDRRSRGDFPQGM